MAENYDWCGTSLGESCCTLKRSDLPPEAKRNLGLRDKLFFCSPQCVSNALEGGILKMSKLHGSGEVILVRLAFYAVVAPFIYFSFLAFGLNLYLVIFTILLIWAGSRLYKY